jgi:hypothetical protein
MSKHIDFSDIRAAVADMTALGDVVSLLCDSEDVDVALYAPNVAAIGRAIERRGNDVAGLLTSLDERANNGGSDE